jgi:hypothetical protein
VPALVDWLVEIRIIDGKKSLKAEKCAAAPKARLLLTPTTA